MDIKFKKEILTTALALVSFAGIIWGAQTYLHNNFASAGEVQQLEKRLDVKILEDRLFIIQDRIWRLEDRYEDNQMPKEVKEQHRVLVDDKNKLEKELDIIKRKNGK